MLSFYLLISHHFITTHTLGILQSSRKLDLSWLKPSFYCSASYLGTMYSSYSSVCCFPSVQLPMSSLSILTVPPCTFTSSISSDHCSSQLCALSKFLPNAVRGGTNVLVSALKTPEISHCHHRTSHSCLSPSASMAVILIILLHLLGLLISFSYSIV